MKEIVLNLTIEEVNLILNALGNLPFNQVQALISKITLQGNSQIQEQKPE